MLENIKFYKYQGTGNDFVMIDNRAGNFPKHREDLIADFCDRRFGVGADGLILIESDLNSDFKMVYFNADGKESSMCGNGGRCIVAFAKQLGIIADRCTFSAVDGLHYAEVNAQNNEVSLQMIDVSEIRNFEDFCFLNTGSPHHVEWVADVDQVAVFSQGRQIRHSELYSPGGTNVNFVEKINSRTLKIRTYERGVEDETLSCGTGATAAAIAFHYSGQTEFNTLAIQVKGGALQVRFNCVEASYCEVFLTGPAQLVFEGTFNLN